MTSLQDLPITRPGWRWLFCNDADVRPVHLFDSFIGVSIKDKCCVDLSCSIQGWKCNHAPRFRIVSEGPMHANIMIPDPELYVFVQTDI